MCACEYVGECIEVYGCVCVGYVWLAALCECLCAYRDVRSLSLRVAVCQQNVKRLTSPAVGETAEKKKKDNKKGIEHK